MSCCFCDGPTHRNPQLTVLREDKRHGGDTWYVVCLECWSSAQEPKHPLSLPPESYEPRWAHQLYAQANGYFWLPCPKCGRSFGGHERHGTLMIDETTGKSTCPVCAAADQPGDVT